MSQSAEFAAPAPGHDRRIWRPPLLVPGHGHRKWAFGRFFYTPVPARRLMPVSASVRLKQGWIASAQLRSAICLVPSGGNTVGRKVSSARVALFGLGCQRRCIAWPWCIEQFCGLAAIRFWLVSQRLCDDFFTWRLCFRTVLLRKPLVQSSHFGVSGWHFPSAHHVRSHHLADGGWRMAVIMAAVAGLAPALAVVNRSSPQGVVRNPEPRQERATADVERQHCSL